MRKIGRLGCVLVGAVYLGAVGGCSTVIFTDGNSNQHAASVEREALIDAAAAVSQTKWPEPDKMSWQARIAHIGQDRVSKSDAAEIYLAALSPAGNKYKQVLSDAGQHLKAADNLAKAAENAANSVRPVMADVSIVESAIGELRQTRDIYAECLKTLARKGEPVHSDDVRDLKSEFDSAIKLLGVVADQLADRVAEDQTETYAGPTQRIDIDNPL